VESLDNDKEQWILFFHRFLSPLHSFALAHYTRYLKILLKPIPSHFKRPILPISEPSLNMRSQILRAACALSIFSCALAIPLAVSATTVTSSCATEELTLATLKSLDIDTFLRNWPVKNASVATANNAQSLADSFGAPNFFC
jgi:hypothetical protein